MADLMIQGFNHDDLLNWINNCPENPILYRSIS